MSLTARRSIHLLCSSAIQNGLPDLHFIVPHIWRFVNVLQSKYPFTFATAKRDVPDEHNRWIQERLVTYFLFGVIAELSAIDQELINKTWVLGSHLSRTIGKGGENFRPREFIAVEKSLAEEIGPKNFELFAAKAEELSLAMNFKLGPVNSAEHVVAWCFRYVRQLLSAAKWESVPHEMRRSPFVGPKMAVS